MISRISLPGGREALIDASDLNLVSEFDWKVKGDKHCSYAYSYKKTTERDVLVHMHRIILAAPSGLYVDHIDGDGLNNTRANLRLCTRAENNRHRIHRHSNTKKPFKGVFTFRQKNKGGLYVRFYGRVDVHGKRFVSPLVETEEEAARGYDRLASLHYGQFAALNFPQRAE
jgi:hypothetical protein